MHNFKLYNFTMLLLFFLIPSISSSPVIGSQVWRGYEISELDDNFCLLPPELGGQGSAVFLEDCENLGIYQD